MTTLLRPMRAEDLEQAWWLGNLAFGGDLQQALPAEEKVGDALVVVDEAGRILAQGRLRHYEQWWGGRAVRMAGLAGVAVHPDARAQGVGSQLVRGLLHHARDQGFPLSALFPTAIGFYRPLGWELVGSLDETRLRTSALRAAGDPVGMRVRTAGPDDVAAVRGLYRWYGEVSAGLLTRSGPEFLKPVDAVLGHDVVALAEAEDGEVLGYVSYDRGRGYGPEAALHVWELVGRTGEAVSALARSLATWEAVVPHVDWRGPTDELSLLLGTPVPEPGRVRPWMLRVLDAAAAVAARGFPDVVSVAAAFALVDGEVVGHGGAWELTVRGGEGRLERVDARASLPLLHVRGLALLYAGAADTALLVRAGLLDRPLPELDVAFAGARPRILDYF